MERNLYSPPAAPVADPVETEEAKGERPKEVTWALRLLWASFVLGGIELLRQLRRRSQVPVIVVSARTAQAERVLCLDAGADDYLPKPFSSEELLARVRAVLRRVAAVDLAERAQEPRPLAITGLIGDFIKGHLVAE